MRWIFHRVIKGPLHCVVRSDPGFTTVVKLLLGAERGTYPDVGTLASL